MPRIRSKYYENFPPPVERRSKERPGSSLSSVPPCALVHALPEELILNLRADAIEPVLRPVGSLLVSGAIAKSLVTEEFRWQRLEPAILTAT